MRNHFFFPGKNLCRVRLGRQDLSFTYLEKVLVSFTGLPAGTAAGQQRCASTRHSCLSMDQN